MTENEPQTNDQSNSKPQLLLQDDFQFDGESLAQALEATGYDVIEIAEDTGLEKTLSGLTEPPDLLIVRFCAGESEPVASLIELRRNKRASRMAILGVARFDQMPLDIPELRSLGVVGVVDERADCPTALRRIDQIFRGTRHGRRAERVRCFLPLTVRRETRHSEEFALDLSSTGMRVTISDPLESNTDIDLAFVLPSLSPQEIAVRARIIHRSTTPNSAGRWEMGIFFYPMSEEAQGLIDAEIKRLLEAA